MDIYIFFLNMAILLISIQKENSFFYYQYYFIYIYSKCQR
jgi:hypothetical protein